MYYQYEWLSDLAIIPAFELFLGGFIAGGLFVGLIWWMELRRQRSKERCRGNEYPAPFYMAEMEEPILTENQQKAVYIANRCLASGMTLAGAAGSIANVEAESAFKSNNLQDCYNASFGVSDEEYTAQIDASTRSFIDSAGYGIAQWTAPDRKKYMLSYHRARGKSIGDFPTQVDCMISEMRGYAKAWNTCTSSNDPAECGYMVCKYYEIPANTEAQALHRGARAQEWFDWLCTLADLNGAAQAPDTSATTAPSKTEKNNDGLKKPETWPPRTVDSHCGGWPEVKLLQASLVCHGHNVLTDGIWTDELTTKIREYQEASGLKADGCVGPKTWQALLKL